MLDRLFKQKIDCAVVDRDLIKTYLGYLVDSDFIAAPEPTPSPKEASIN